MLRNVSLSFLPVTLVTLLIDHQRSGYTSMLHQEKERMLSELTTTTSLLDDVQRLGTKSLLFYTGSCK